MDTTTRALAADAKIELVWVARLTGHGSGMGGCSVGPVPVRDTGNTLLAPEDPQRKALFDSAFGQGRRLARPLPDASLKDGFMDRWYARDRETALRAAVAGAAAKLESARRALEIAEAQARCASGLLEAPAD